MNLVLPLLLGTPLAFSSNPVELAIARAFLREAHTGLGESASASFDAEDPDEVDERLLERGIRTYTFPSGVVDLNVTTHRVRSYSARGQRGPEPVYDEDGGVVPRQVDDAQAAALARRLYAAAGRCERIEVTEIADRRVNNEADVEVRFTPYCTNVPYLADCMITVDRQMGRLDTLWLASLPTAPPTLEPLGTPDDARLVAFRAALAWKAGGLGEGEYGPLRLYVWRGTPEGLGTRQGPRAGTFAEAGSYRSYTGAEAAAAAANRGTLVYAGSLRAANGEPVYVRLDARTGHVLTMNLMNFGRGGFGEKAKSRPVTVPTVSRPWRVGTGLEGWKAWSAPATASLAPVAGKVPSTGAKTLLTDGVAAFSATYDAKANLLAVEGKTYRPGPALATLLRKRAKR